MVKSNLRLIRNTSAGFRVWLWWYAIVPALAVMADCNAQLLVYAAPNAVVEFKLDDILRPEPVVIMVELPVDDSQTRHLVRVRSSCPCLQVLAYPALIAPGQSRRVALRLHVDRVGGFQYQLWIEQHNGSAYRIIINGRAMVAADVAPIDFGIAHALLPRSVTPLPNISLITSAEILADWREQQKWIMVDIRATDAYRHVHLPGTLNLTMPALRTAPPLRDQHVVLLGQGQASPRLVAAGKRLAASGSAASVRLLDGGLARLARTHGSNMLSGDASTLHVLSAAAFHESRTVEGWLVVDATAGNEPLLEHILPYRLPLSNIDTPGVWQHDAVGAPLQCVLVLEDADSTVQFNDSAIPASLDRFRLAGGWRAYVQFLHEQSAYLQRETVQSRSAGGCEGCP